MVENVLGETALERGPHCQDEAGMSGFRIYKEEEILRLNELQAEYFGKIKHVFDPPLPAGVPQRLRRIVRSAEITASDSVLDIGTGTGILIPVIEGHSPALVYANDLSKAMLESVKSRHPSVVTVHGDVRDLALPDDSIDVAFINACYSNIIDKHKAFTNIGRMTRDGGRVIISHPMGRSFVGMLKPNVPFPLDDFPPDPTQASDLFSPYGFRVSMFIDQEELYILRLQRNDRERD
jgi:SAM-dependent methyltransferase